MKLQRHNNAVGSYYVEIGWRMFGMEIRHQRFGLGKKGRIARERAEKLWELWRTQDGRGPETGKGDCEGRR